jgi:GT2 family glycosyltransferase
MIDLSIIIVSWNSLRDLEQCLPSLGAGCAKHSFEVLLVDNASTDDSVAYARQALQSLTVITNGSNAGFARANNQAMAVATGRYLCLLNPDTIVHPGALDILLTFLDGETNVWACGPGLLNGDGTAQRTGVRFPSLWNIAVEAVFLDRLFPYTQVFGSHRELYEQGPEAREVEFVQGSCIVVRREVKARIGGLDERFFMYFEETDWCRRIAGAGGKVCIVPAASVTHFGGGTTGHYDERRVVHYHESLLRYFGKHRGPIAQCLVRMIVFGRSCVRLLLWLLIGVSRPRLRATAFSSMRGYARVLGLVFTTAKTS